MAIYDEYKKLSSLEDVSFIAGTDYFIEFPLYDTAGTRLPLTSMSAKWLLSKYGQPNFPIAEINCTTVQTDGNNYSFRVDIPRGLTYNLGGLYTQQIEISYYGNKKMRPVQGTVVIHRAITSMPEDL